MPTESSAFLTLLQQHIVLEPEEVGQLTRLQFFEDPEIPSQNDGPPMTPQRPPGQPSSIAGSPDSPQVHPDPHRVIEQQEKQKISALRQKLSELLSNEQLEKKLRLYHALEKELCAQSSEQHNNYKAILEILFNALSRLLFFDYFPSAKQSYANIQYSLANIQRSCTNIQTFYPSHPRSTINPDEKKSIDGARAAVENTASTTRPTIFFLLSAGSTRQQSFLIDTQRIVSQFRSTALTLNEVANKSQGIVFALSQKQPIKIKELPTTVDQIACALQSCRMTLERPLVFRTMRFTSHEKWAYDHHHGKLGWFFNKLRTGWEFLFHRKKQKQQRQLQNAWHSAYQHLHGKTSTLPGIILQAVTTTKSDVNTQCLCEFEKELIALSFNPTGRLPAYALRKTIRRHGLRLGLAESQITGICTQLDLDKNDIILINQWAQKQLQPSRTPPVGLYEATTATVELHGTLKKNVHSLAGLEKNLASQSEEASRVSMLSAFKNTQRRLRDLTLLFKQFRTPRTSHTNYHSGHKHDFPKNHPRRTWCALRFSPSPGGEEAGATLSPRPAQ